MRGVGDHGAFVSAGFFGLLATGLYTLQVAKNSQIYPFRSDLLFLEHVARSGP